MNFQQDSKENDADERKRAPVTGKLRKNGSQSEKETKSTRNCAPGLRTLFPKTGRGQVPIKKKCMKKSKKMKRRRSEWKKGREDPAEFKQGC